MRNQSRLTPPGVPTPAITKQTQRLSASVIIAAHADERWTRTLRALASARAQIPPPLEVILVIDHNPLLAAQARVEAVDVTVLETNGSRGASASRNTGVAASSGELAVFLDDDQAASSPNWLTTLIRHFDDPRVIGVGGGITPEWSNARPGWFPREFDWVVGASYAGMPEHVQPIRNVWGGNTAVRRVMFDAVGGFRAGFGKTGHISRPEDTDLCLRLQAVVPAGYWLYDPAASVAHHVPPDRSTFGFFVRRCWHEGRGKAALGRLVGRDRSLSSERGFVARVLPSAIARELGKGLVGGDLDSLKRSAALLVGLIASGAGWLMELVVGARWVGHLKRRGRDDA